MSSYGDYLSRISQSTDKYNSINDSFHDIESCRHPDINNMFRGIPLTPPSNYESNHTSNTNPMLEQNISSNESNNSNIDTFYSISRYSYIPIQYHHYIIECVTNTIFLLTEKILLVKLFEYEKKILILTLLRGLMYIVINLDIYYNNTDIIIFIYSCIRNNTQKYPIIIFIIIQTTISYIIDIILYSIYGDKYLIPLNDIFPSTREDYIYITIFTLLYYIFVALILSKQNHVEIKIINLCGVYYIINSINIIPKYSTLSSYLLLFYSYNIIVDNNLYILYGILLSGLIIMLIIMRFRLRNEII